MSDDKIMTQASVNKKNTPQTNNNGTPKTRKSEHNSVSTKGRAVQGVDSLNGNGRETDSDITCIEESRVDSPKTQVTTVCLHTREETADDALTEKHSPARENGVSSSTVDGKQTERSRFTKQQSEASSSGATAEMNTMNDSMITNESSLADKSLVTSTSLVTDKSVGAQSGQSEGSDQSDAIIKVCSLHSLTVTQS